MTLTQGVLVIVGNAAVVALSLLVNNTKAADLDATAGYPAPRYPTYMLRPASDEVMRFLGKSIARMVNTHTGRLGIIGAGQKGLIVISDDQDMRLVEVAVKAVRDRGGEAEYIYTRDLVKETGGMPAELSSVLIGKRSTRSFSIEEGFRETFSQFGVNAFSPDLIKEHFPEVKDRQDAAPSPAMLEGLARKLSPAVRNALPDNWLSFSNLQFARVFLADATWKYLQAHPKYDYVFSEWWASAVHRRIMTKVLGEKFQLGWRIPDVASVAAQGMTYPSDLDYLAQEKILEVIPWIETVHIMDGEGTDLRFSVTPEQAMVWHMGASGTNLELYPSNTLSHVMLARITAGVEEENVPLTEIVPPTEGVIVGSMNHRGFYQAMKVHIKNGKVEKVEGGGRVGLLFRALLEDPKIKNAHLPGLPYPGFFYFFHYHLGVNPRGVFNFGDVHGDLRRAGSASLGFGFESMRPEFLEYAAKHDLPIRHGFHIHHHFPTYEVTLRGRGKKVHKLRLVDRSRVAALQDAEVRALAARYGDPDELLNVDWVPDRPGINVPGDYEKDFGRDPVSYWQRTKEMILAGTYPFLLHKTFPVVK